MKNFFIGTLIIVLLSIAALAVLASFCYDVEAPLLVFIAERIAFAAVCVGCYKAAEKIAKAVKVSGR